MEVPAPVQDQEVLSNKRESKVWLVREKVRALLLLSFTSGAHHTLLTVTEDVAKLQEEVNENRVKIASLHTILSSALKGLVLL